MNSLLLLAQAAPGPLQSATDTLQTFGVNFPLFLSNFVSFLIVCFLLNKFAYQPVVTVLEARREKIAESLRNADRIKSELADAEAKKAEILSNANIEATRMIEEARASAAAIAEKKTQQAIAEAEGIVSKARDASRIEHDRMLSDLKREVGQLVIQTTTAVTGKILTPDDQRRINEETATQIAA